jgi:hypothetical protein
VCYWPASIPWDEIPPKIYTGDNVTPVAHFLYMCYFSIYSTPTDNGTYAFLPNIRNAFNDMFYYSGATIIEKDDYSQSNWESLLRTEIDNNRPVLYYGKNSLTSGWHYFVLDGYWLKDDGSYLYNFNFGQTSAHSTYIALSETGYQIDQQALIHIQPNCDAFSGSYTYVEDIPAGIFASRYAGINFFTSKNIEPQGNLILKAGNSVVLNPGFWAKPGSSFLAKTATCGPAYPSHSKRAVINGFELDNQTLQIEQKGITEEEVQIYPNPASEILNIDFGNLSFPIDVKIQDISGKCIWSYAGSSKKQICIDVKGFTKGLYFVKISNSTLNLYKKIIIN